MVPPSRSSWTLHKFGGTSVANTERYQAVWKILKSTPGRPTAVVVSAMRGVTDALLEAVHLAERDPKKFDAKLAEIQERHATAAQGLLTSDAKRRDFLQTLAADMGKIRELLTGISHSKHASESQREWVSGYGEVWSAQLLCQYIQSQNQACAWLDAREVLIVTPHDRAVNVDWTASSARFKKWLSTETAEIVVITGFIASTPDGIATTLKRNGSDFSASIFGKLLSASSITIWTDVDGVLSADPRMVPQAKWISQVSYLEATELAYFGAKVVHPSTMAPAIETQIPIWIRNSFAPEKKGTLIHTHGDPTLTVCGFATIEKIALVNVEGRGMLGVPGVAERLFGSLRAVGVSVVLISQASSEHSICFAIPADQLETARAALDRSFRAEIEHKEIESISADPHCSILAAVGDNMVDRPGVSGTFFSALGKAQVNVKAIAQGSSERNISVVIESNAMVKALRATHSAFTLSPEALAIGVVGTGNVGKTFLDQLSAIQAKLPADLKLFGTLSTRKMALFDTQGNANESATADTEAWISHLLAQEYPHTVILDLTASEDIAGQYRDWMKRGIHVVTANKKLGSGEWTRYQDVKQTAEKGRRHFLYETTVGGGLPVLRTLRDLLRAGDRVLKIEGILSGTLSYLFNAFDGTRSFSQVLREAHKLGLTEPDPRDDLSGMDVARKLVILAREMGLSLSLSDIKVESLLPKDAGGTVDEFFAKITAEDAAWLKRYKEAKKDQSILRYVAKIDDKQRASVKLESYALTHPMSNLRATDNFIAFTTERYRTQPLIVQGPGAGPVVTASGVLSDLLRLVTYVGGRS